MTGLEGLYDFRLDWGSGRAGAISSSDVMSSVQILGLKLEPRKLPIERLILEHAEKVPVEN